MRDLWNAAEPPKKEEKGKINEPIKLQSVGIRRLVERALWARDFPETSLSQVQCDS